MNVGYAEALGRWQRSLELLARMPPDITENLVNDLMLADVAAVLSPDPDQAVELRVVLLWAVGGAETGLADELAGQLHGSVPRARPVLSVVSLEQTTPAAQLREQLARAHAVVIVVGYYDLVSEEPAADATGRMAEAADWLAWTAGWLEPDHVTIAVHGRATRRSDPVSRADWVRQMAVSRLGLPRTWPPRVIVETGPDAVRSALSSRVLDPFRANLAGAYGAATYQQVRHAVQYTASRCAAIRAMTDVGADVPAARRWTWLQAHAAGRVAGTVAAALEVSGAADGR